MKHLFLALALVFTSSTAPRQQPTDFSRLVARLSEPGGFFDSDNLVSNETSYQHVMPALRTLGVRGGAYLGVGPEQNFTYLAEIKPEVALLIDIRRDNMLLHLLFKAMFETSENRMQYLCLLYGRPQPPDLGKWTDRPLDEILLYLDVTPGDSAVHRANHTRLMDRVTGYGVPLTDQDRATLQRFHAEFAVMGLELRYTSLNRPSRPGYPSQRDLYLATDFDGRPAGYLTTEERWRTVRELEQRDRVIPVVGDVSGPTAMTAIAAYLTQRKLKVSAFYLSNVEQYLFRNGVFPQFVANVRALPVGPGSVMIRSSFGRGWRYDGGAMPMPLPGHLSVQVMQTIPAFLQLTANAAAVGYGQLLSEHVIDLRARPQ